jgi:hypothetical protein
VDDIGRDPLAVQRRRYRLMAVQRRYFDRTPGSVTSETEVTRIINNYTSAVPEVQALTEDVLKLRADVDAVAAGVETDVNGRLQTITGATGAIVVDVSQGTEVIISTAGSFTLSFTGWPVTATTVTVLVRTTTTGHNLTAISSPHVYATATDVTDVTWTGGQQVRLTATHSPIDYRTFVEVHEQVAAPTTEPTPDPSPDVFTVQYWTGTDYTVAGTALNGATVGSAVGEVSSSPTFEQSVVKVEASTTRTVTFTLATAPAADDVILLFINSGTVNGNFTTPSGWTNVLGGNTKVDSDDHSASCFWHVVTSTEAAASTTTWTLTNFFNATTQQHTALAVVYSAVDTTTPIDEVGSYNNATPATGASVPALTPTSTGGRVVAFVANDAGTAANTTPTGWTSRAVSSSSARTQAFEWDTNTTAAVATNAPSVVGASDEKAVIVVALTPGTAPSATGSSTITVGISQPYKAGLSKVRLWSDYPTVDLTDLDTWESDLATAQANEHFVAEISAAPFVDVDVSLLTDPTGNGDAAWLVDDDHAFTFQWLYADTNVDHATATFTVNNGVITAPTPPATPTGLAASTAGGDGQVALTWNAVSGCTYQTRYGTANPPAAATPTNSTTTSRTITGLTPATALYFQVRAVHPTDGPSAWSSTVSATPTGTNAGNPAKTTRFGTVTTGSLYKYSASFGTRQRTEDYWMPWAGQRSNFQRGFPERWATDVVNACKAAVDKYNQVGGPVHPDARARGPRVNMGTGDISFVGHNAKRLNSNGVVTNNHINSCLGLARGLRGDYDTQWNNMLDAVIDLSYGGFSDFDSRLILGISHETDIMAYGNFSGYDRDLIGNTALVNASNAEWGAEIAGILRTIGTTGRRATLFRKSFEKFAAMVRAKSDNIQIALTLTSGADGTGTDESLNVFDTDALPTRADSVDILLLDAYCRDSFRNVTTGLQAAMPIFEDYADQLGAYIGFGEYNGQYKDAADSVFPGAPTDAQAVAWFTYVWNYIRDNQVPWHVFWSPKPEKPGSTWQPSPTMYPLTTAYWKQKFPKPPNGVYT